MIDLTPEARRNQPKMGDKNSAFVEQANELAKRDDSALPRSFSVEEFSKDVDLLRHLAPIIVASAQFHEWLGDADIAVGSEAYYVAA